MKSVIGVALIKVLARLGAFIIRKLYIYPRIAANQAALCKFTGNRLKKNISRNIDGGMSKQKGRKPWAI